jgi:hypothetical protein
MATDKGETMMQVLLPVLVRTYLVLGRIGNRRAERDERGDVPGWVLVTVMTAGLVMAIWGVADDQLKQMLQDALDSVKN